VCVIDDDESVRRALQRLIRCAGMDAVTFATAEAFLACPEQAAPGCLILDVHLPGLSGLELQERLTAGGRAVSVVFITAYAEEHVRELALQAGATAFLHKPFDEQVLLDALARALRADRRDA
jgi:FixJ family two-component response regulator